MATRKRKTQKNAAKRRTPRARISAALKKYLGSLKKSNPAFKKAVAVRVKTRKTGTVTLTPLRSNPRGGAYATRFHRDGTVTFWNVYSQTWRRLKASDIGDSILSTLSKSERNRIERMAKKERW